MSQTDTHTVTSIYNTPSFLRWNACLTGTYKHTFARIARRCRQRQRNVIHFYPYKWFSTYIFVSFILYTFTLGHSHFSFVVNLLSLWLERFSTIETTRKKEPIWELFKRLVGVWHRVIAVVNLWSQPTPNKRYLTCLLFTLARRVDVGFCIGWGINEMNFLFQEGEIWYRGPNVMSGYYENRAATDEVLTRDGWYRTGDIGRYDDNKYLYVTDRLKELIKVWTLSIFPVPNFVTRNLVLNIV